MSTKKPWGTTGLIIFTLVLLLGPSGFKVEAFKKLSTVLGIILATKRVLGGTGLGGLILPGTKKKPLFTS